MEKDEYAKILEKLIAYCVYLPRSKKQILEAIDKYIPKIYSEPERASIESFLMTKLQELGLLGDVTAAEKYVLNAVYSTKPRSRWVLKQFLLKKGFNDNDIEKALSKFTNEIENAHLLKEYNTLKKRYIDFSIKNKQKIKSKLINKGYDVNQINTLLDEDFDRT